jgi:hypothetical protein
MQININQVKNKLMVQLSMVIKRTSDDKVGASGWEVNKHGPMLLSFAVGAAIDRFLKAMSLRPAQLLGKQAKPQ